MKLLALAVALAAHQPAAHQTLYFDAVPTHTANHAEIARGVLRDARNRAVGRFAFDCRLLGGGRERCSGWGQTAQGRIGFAGPARRSDSAHTFAITRSTGAYRGARGTIAAHDLNGGESLIKVKLAPRAGVVLRSGVLRLAAANAAFRARADARCATAAARLAKLPPFPFADFDALHPDPQLLPQVGQFFTGPHDPRPILDALDAQLRALGQPPADGAEWARVLAARAASRAVDDEQDRAALAADVPAFVKSVHDVASTYRAVAIGATVFGVARCAI
jgi:hypothetical protein